MNLKGKPESVKSAAVRYSKMVNDYLCEQDIDRAAFDEVYCLLYDEDVLTESDLLFLEQIGL